MTGVTVASGHFSSMSRAGEKCLVRGAIAARRAATGTLPVACLMRRQIGLSR
jgi:hypothetical protein